MIRWTLLPFSSLYWIVTSLRNLLYNWKIIPSKQYHFPLICVGNLSVGGTGKSPHCIYIVDLLKDIKKTAVLSRGYGRLTSGYKIANYKSNYKIIGDEPMQMFLRFKNKIVVAVCENRQEGIASLLKEFSPEIIILDDAFQHRSVTPNFSIVLTEYDNLFSKDYLLPAGSLRESRRGIKRADVLIITKSPENLSFEEKIKTIQSLKLKKELPLFFSHIKYDNQIISTNYKIDFQELQEYSVLLVTGIANDSKLLNFVKNNVKTFHHIPFKDHHNFTETNIKEIEKKFSQIEGEKLILTTEKDYTRLLSFKSILNNLFYLPINVEIDEKEKFDSLIYQHVTKYN